MLWKSHVKFKVNRLNSKINIVYIWNWEKLFVGERKLVFFFINKTPGKVLSIMFLTVSFKRNDLLLLIKPKVGNLFMFKIHIEIYCQ